MKDNIKKAFLVTVMSSIFMTASGSEFVAFHIQENKEGKKRFIVKKKNIEVFGTWSSWLDYETEYNCTNWMPAVPETGGVSFEQSKVCSQKQKSSRDVFELQNDGSQVFNRVEDRLQTIEKSYTRMASVLSTRSDPWSSWFDEGVAFNCTEWLPRLDSIDSDSTVEQTRDCYQLQKQEKNIVNVWNTGDENIRTVKTNTQTVLIGQSRESQGTREDSVEAVNFTQFSYDGYESALAVDDKGGLWAYGKNSYGQFGLSDKSIEYTEWTKLSVSEVSKAHVESNKAYVVFTDGKLYASGRNLEGSLGVGKNDPEIYTWSYTGLNNIKDLAVAFDTTFLISNDNYVYYSGIKDFVRYSQGATIAPGVNYDSNVFVKTPMKSKDISISPSTFFATIDFDTNVLQTAGYLSEFGYLGRKQPTYKESGTYTMSLEPLNNTSLSSADKIMTLDKTLMAYDKTSGKLYAAGRTWSTGFGRNFGFGEDPSGESSGNAELWDITKGITNIPSNVDIKSNKFSVGYIDSSGDFYLNGNDYMTGFGDLPYFTKVYSNVIDFDMKRNGIMLKMADGTFRAFVGGKSWVTIPKAHY